MIANLSTLLKFRQDSIQGYCKHYSVSAGSTINFYVSSKVDYSVSYHKLSDPLFASIKSLNWQTNNQKSHYQYTPFNSWQNGCNWKKSFSLKIPPNTKSGIYAAKCTGIDNSEHYIVFIVTPNLNNILSKIAVIANTNTWNAYNQWGGKSRYTNPYQFFTKISFDRPNLLTSPIADYNDLNPSHLTRAELWIHSWLESVGYKIDVYSDNDFHTGVVDFNKYKAIILNTHPEYWTTEMYDRLTKYLESGRSLLYLGGNGIFECLEYDKVDNSLVFMGGVPYQDRDTFYFRNKPKTERDILGVGFMYDNYNSIPAPFEILLPNHKFLKGTNLGVGDLVGTHGLYGAASGREMDRMRDFNLPDDSGIVNAWVNGKDRGTSPPNIQLIAKGTNSSYDNQGPHSADLTYYETNHGGFVLSAGSMIFGGSLVLDYKLQKIIHNALTEALK